jgi:AraC family transcriptional regulator
MRRHQHYEDRVNRVLDYIATHLDGELSLTRLSEVACFSPFHFHRIFQGVTGETLNSHVRRVRLERAALLMRTSPRKRITDVALEVGFPGTAEFSRAFRVTLTEPPVLGTGEAHSKKARFAKRRKWARSTL